MADLKVPKKITKYKLRMTFNWSQRAGQVLTWEFQKNEQQFDLGTGDSDLVPGPGNKFEMEVQGYELTDKTDGFLYIIFEPRDGAPTDILSVNNDSVLASGLQALEVKNLQEDRAVKVKPKKLPKNSTIDDWDIINHSQSEDQDPVYYEYKLSGILNVNGVNFSFDPKVKVGPHR